MEKPVEARALTESEISAVFGGFNSPDEAIKDAQAYGLTYNPGGTDWIDQWFGYNGGDWYYEWNDKGEFRFGC